MVFKQIWRIKRLAFFLNRSVRNTMRAGNTEVAVYACTCRNMMTNFVNLLHNYFMLEAIEHNFDKF